MLPSNSTQVLSACQRQVGYVMLLTVMLLCGLGIVILFSIGGQFAPRPDAMMYGYATQQVKWLIIGGVACIVFSFIDYHVLLKWAPLVVAAAICLLVLCFVPGIGKAANGSSRWLSLGGINLQPSEFAKLAMIFFLASWMAGRYGNPRDFWRGFLFPSIITACVIAPVLKAPDLGTTLLMALTFFCIMYTAGTYLVYLAGMVTLAVGGLLHLAINMPNRWERLVAFMNPDLYQLTTNYQPIQALIALGSGGFQGLGLGMGRQKMQYLPFCHTDFIFPIIGEELGACVTLSVVALYLVFAVCGFWIAVHAPDDGGYYLGMGLTSLIALQAMMNLLVVTSLMPNKGLPLPFISYGGSSLLFSLIAVGILFNLHRQGLAGDALPSGGVVLPERPSPRM